MWDAQYAHGVALCVLLALQSLKKYLRKQKLDSVKVKYQLNKSSVAFITFRNEAAREVGGVHKCHVTEGSTGIGWWQDSGINYIKRDYNEPSIAGVWCDLVLGPTQCLHIIARC